MIPMWLISWIIDKVKERKRIPQPRFDYSNGYRIPKKLMERGYSGKYNDMW